MLMPLMSHVTHFGLIKDVVMQVSTVKDVIHRVLLNAKKTHATYKMERASRVNLDGLDNIVILVR